MLVAPVGWILLLLLTFIGWAGQSRTKTDKTARQPVSLVREGERE